MRIDDDAFAPQLSRPHAEVLHESSAHSRTAAPFLDHDGREQGERTVRGEDRQAMHRGKPHHPPILVFCHHDFHASGCRPSYARLKGRSGCGIPKLSQELAGRLCVAR